MMVGTANAMNSAPLSTLYRFTAFIKPDPSDLDEVLEWLTAVPETASDVVGQREAALDDRIALSPSLDRVCVERRQMAKHDRHVGILRIWL